jgi:hypothetical protein
MAQVELQPDGKTFRFPELAIGQSCTIFETNPLGWKCEGQFRVSPEILRTFLSENVNPIGWSRTSPMGRRKLFLLDGDR